MFFDRLIPVFALLLGSFLLSACTAGSKGSSQDLASVLSVSDAERVEGATRKSTSTETKTKPDTKVALASVEEKKPASAKAAESAVRAKSNAKEQKPTSNFGRDANTTLVVNNQKSRRKQQVRTRASLNTRSKIRKPRNRRDTGDLPGVSIKKLFGILGNSEKNYELDEPVEVASIASRARRGTFGLLLQTKNVQVGCFPRRLVKILKRVERRYRRTPIVTSGYRSRAKNRRIRGARNSTHISCKAADIQVKGVSKWQLAKFLRSLPGRGGVGTYCHTRSVHIDIGVKRDWNWRCRRRKRS